jgi:hypothetical protein
MTNALTSPRCDGFSLARLGHLLARHQGQIAVLQWMMVVVYFVLLIGPVLLPAASANAGLAQDLARWADILFWGVWWPAVILSMMLIGQFWCGLLCPDGTVTEFASRHGLGRRPPAWLRRPELPIVAYAAIAVLEYGWQAHGSALGTLLVVGSTSAAALLCGLVYGRGKRVWCRHGCPVGGVLSLLARCSVLQFRVDRVAWDAAPKPLPKPLDCPLLLDVKRMTRSDKCNMCARCSGHRGAVALSWRAPGAELLSLRDDEVPRWEALGIVFVLVGLLYGAMHGPQGTWLEQFQVALPKSLPWLAGPLAVLLPGLVLSGAGSAALWASATGSVQAARLAYAWIPLGGLGLFCGAIEHALLLLQQQGFAVAELLPLLRAPVLLLAFAWSAWTGLQLLQQVQGAWLRARQALFLAATATLALAYQFAPNPLAHTA